MSKNIFNYNRILKPICELITNHKYRRMIGWDKSYSENGYKYANRHDFYYKCKICGYTFFNHRPTKKEIEYIKEYDRKDNNGSKGTKNKRI